MDAYAFSVETLSKVARLLDAARAKGLTLTTAESCTGGLIAAALTEVAGSSDVIWGGVVAYANAAKQSRLGVPAALLAEHGAVSAPVAAAMASGALADGDIAIAVTGVAGPGGGSDAKPVGLVFLAIAGACVETVREARFGDLGRAGVRAATLEVALAMLQEAVDASGAP